MGGIILTLVAVIAIIILVCIGRQRQTKHLTVSDPVTGALNMTGFRLAAEKSFRSHTVRYSLVVMELRNAYQIYETFGSVSSQKVQEHLYTVLKSNLGSAEPIARINNDTFVFLLKNHQEDEIRARLKLIYEQANRFNQQRVDPYRLNLCFGIHVRYDTAEPLEDLIKKAAHLLKAPGSEPRYRFYENPARDPQSRRLELLGQVDRSMKNGDFIVYLQPLVRLGDRRIAGAEALVRWRHPQRGLLAPATFVPLLQEYRKIYQLDLYLFEAICQMLAGWKEKGWELCPISVNLSRETLDVDRFLDSYARLCQAYGVSPELIEFELAESYLLENSQKISALIDEIRSHGFRCSLDNFGKSFIPLDLLRELDVDAIKLDRSFFYGENNNRRNRFIIEAILKMAAQMHIRTVAEGIDNDSQVQYLQQAACDMIQGFHYFRPMSVEEFETTAYQDGILRYVEPEGSRSAAATQHPAARQTSSSIIMFSYLPDEDRVIFSDSFSPILENQLIFSNALALFRGSNLIHENDREDFFHLLERCQKEDGWVKNAIRFYASEGRYEWLEVHLYAEQTAPRGSTHISGTLVNMAGWTNEVNRWKEKANRDALTGLFNREYFEQFSRSTLEKDTLISAAIVFIDIDDFKHVNDTLGHMFGDDILCCVAKRVLGVFRHTDIVARYGGDEFVVFVNGIARAELEKRLTQLCDVFRFPYRNDTVTYQISGSIGAAMFPDDGENYQDLLDHADCAVYAAKERGKDQFAMYEPYMEGSSSRN